MENQDQIYRELQKVLDKETVGFPATESGCEIDLLKHLFTPEQAKAATYLTYKLEPVEKIAQRVEPGGYSVEELEEHLNGCAKYGVIVHKVKNGVRHYGTLHYLIGMAEAGMYKGATPEWTAAVQAYMADGQFLERFLNSKVSQMRTIPIEQSINKEHHIGSYDALAELIEKSPGPFAVYPCICRVNSKAAGTPCKKTDRDDTCMAFNNTAKNAIEFSGAREISREEALEICRQNAADGLVLQPANTQEIDYMCSCCSCCCGLIQMHKMMPDGINHWTTNFQATVDADNCTGCGECVESCQLDAVAVDEDQGIAVVNLMKCLGCGNCVPHCPTEAIALKKRENEFVPPVTSEELNEMIMSAK